MRRLTPLAVAFAAAILCIGISSASATGVNAVAPLAGFRFSTLAPRRSCDGFAALRVGDPCRFRRSRPLIPR